MTESLSLIETIAKIDRLSTFSRLMATSGANEALSAGGDFTVFAPTNDAFRKVPDDRMNALLQEDGQTTLRSLLSYHIVPDRFLAASLGSVGRAPTISGEEVTFTDGSGGLKINKSGVEARNIVTANGVVHELDTVLNYDIATLKTEPLEMPEIEAPAALPELDVPTLSLGETDDGRVANIARAGRTGRSRRWSGGGSFLF